MKSCKFLKCSILCFLIFSFCSNANAHIPFSRKGMFKSNFTPMQIGVFPGASLFNYNSVYGLSVSIPMTLDEEVYGISTGIFGMVSEHFGIQMNLLNGADQIYGIQGGLVSYALWCDGIQIGGFNKGDDINGLQLGIFNKAEECTLQIGMLNYNESGFLKYFPFFNFTVE